MSSITNACTLRMTCTLYICTDEPMPPALWYWGKTGYHHG